MCFEEYPFKGRDRMEISSISRMVPMTSIMAFRIKSQSEQIRIATIRLMETDHEPNDNMVISYQFGGGLEKLRKAIEKKVIHISGISFSCNKIESKLMLIRFYQNEKKYTEGKISAQWLPMDSACAYTPENVYPRAKINSHNFKFQLTKKSIIEMYMLPGESVDLTLEVWKVDDISSKTFTDWLKEKK